MMRNWKMAAVLTVLLAALAFCPVTAKAAADQKDTDIKDIKKRLDSIDGALAKIQEDADAIRAEGLKIQTFKARLKSMEEQMGQFKTVLDALKKAIPPKGKIASYPPESMDDIKDRLDRIERILAKLGPNTRIAKAAPEIAKVILTNNYTEDMLFILNNRDTIRLAPGTLRQIDGTAAGTFTYEVVSPTWGSRIRKTVSLAANETFRITVD